MSVSKNRRTPISKRRRFDVFKRDGFACQYCGRKTPEVVLEVDHIIPVSEGGENDTDNLATACFECNRGKAAKSLKAIPEPMRERAARIKEAEAQLAEYAKIMEERRARIDEQVWKIIWKLHPNRDTVPRTWVAGITKFLDRLSYPEIMHAADITLLKCIRDDNKEFRYFCGTCWGMIRERSGQR